MQKGDSRADKSWSGCNKIHGNRRCSHGGVEPGFPQLTAEEMNVIVSEAKRVDRMTATHAQGSQGILDAVKVGVDSIEHGIFLTDEIIDEMLERGTWLVPTLIAPLAIIEAGTPFNMHGTSGREIQLMISAGTSKSAKLLRVEDEKGTLSIGKIANILILNKNPLLSPEILLKDKDVYQNGDLVI